LNRQLHIVCFDTPFPPDCGQSIEAFEKISALHKNGVKIHLHCFEHCEQSHNELNNYCDHIQIHHQKNISEVADSLNKDSFPVLIENIHSPSILHLIKAQQRKIILRVRSENICTQKKNFVHKILPIRLLRPPKEETVSLPPEFLYACISPRDVEFLQQKHRLTNVEYLPPFISWQTIKSKTGTGNFCLYHADLSDKANERMAFWLVEKIFSEIRFPFIIAGKNPSRRIDKLANLYSHVCIISNPTKREIDELVQKAHINIVPSFQPGKIYKLLHSLFEGRHCITNEIAVENTDLARVCHIANNTRSKIEIIKKLMNMPFTEHEIEYRRKILLPEYSNQKNIAILLNWLYK